VAMLVAAGLLLLGAVVNAVGIRTAAAALPSAEAVGSDSSPAESVAAGALDET